MFSVLGVLCCSAAESMEEQRDIDDAWRTNIRGNNNMELDV